MVDPEKVKELSEALLHDPEFNEFHSYNNPKVTKQYVAEIAGLGVIDRLLQNVELLPLQASSRRLS